MMLVYLKLGLGLLRFVNGNGNVVPTNPFNDAIQINGMSPLPTGGFELLKRQSSHETLCGYFDGDPGNTTS